MNSLFFHVSILLCLLIDQYGNAVYEGRRVLLVAGNFTLDEERVNIAQYDILHGT
jgi:hypothetical protein